MTSLVDIGAKLFVCIDKVREASVTCGAKNVLFVMFWGFVLLVCVWFCFGFIEQQPSSPEVSQGQKTFLKQQSHSTSIESMHPP